MQICSQIQEVDLARYVFQLTGYADTAADLEENVNGIGGKLLLDAIRLRLAERGYDCDAEVGAEDWGWYFSAQRNGRTYLCGAQSYTTRMAANRLTRNRF
jgi:hypothetical protein